MEGVSFLIMKDSLLIRERLSLVQELCLFCDFQGQLADQPVNIRALRVKAGTLNSMKTPMARLTEAI